MPTNWYGNAQSAKQAPRTASGQRTLKAVGGMRSQVRAIYGSTDRAELDHGNDPLCRLAPASAHFTNDPRYSGDAYTVNVHRYAAHEEPVTRQFASAHSGPKYDPDAIIARAIKLGMTVVEYCARIGVSL